MCSFDSFAVDNLIKNHIINSFQEERVRDVLINNSDNLTANDVIEVRSRVEAHPFASTPELFESYLFLKNQQKKLMKDSIKMKKDSGMNAYQHKQPEITKSLALTVVSRNDSLYKTDELEKSDNGEKLRSYSNVNLARMDPQSDVTSNTPNKIAALEVSLSHPKEGTSNLKCSPPVRDGPACQESIAPCSRPPSIPLRRPGIIFQKEESSKARKKKVLEQNMTATAAPVISAISSSFVSSIASNTINTVISSALTSDINVLGTTTTPAADIKCDPNFSVKESTLRKSLVDSDAKAYDSEKDDAIIKTVNCQVCSISFPKERLLSDHMLSMHPDVNTINRWICCICRTGFSMKILLENHVAEIHKNDQDTNRYLTCNKCGLNFRDRKSLITHKKKNHWKRKERRFPCECCNYVSISNAALVAHRRIHTGEKPFMCEVCGKNFSALIGLEVHQRIHTGEKPYKCGYCDLAFKTTSHRLYHERIHRNERPYICEQCGKTFPKSYELKMHIDSHNETRVKRFLCHCGAAFYTRRNLKRHEVSHSGIKPFKCEICGACFTRPENLKCHQKSKACHNRASKLN